MSNLDFPRRSGDPIGGQGQLRSVQDLTARVQRLIDLPKPEGGYPLEWHVEASHVGDLTAIAVAALRSAKLKDTPT